MKAKTEVLIINGSFAGGGANQIAYTLYDSLKERYSMSALVGDQYLPDETVKSLSSDNPLYLNWEKVVLYLSIITGTQYLAGKYLLKRTFNNFSRRGSYSQSDLVHLHNLHGMNFNLDILPRITHEKPVIWTLQDEWSFTGHCAKTMRCVKWREAQCHNCPFLTRYSPILIDTSNYFFERKKRLYGQSKFQLVAASNWLAGMVKSSILAEFPLTVIHNGADINIFKPGNKKQLKRKLGLPENKFVIAFIANHGNKNPWKGSHFMQEIAKRRINADYLFLSIGNPASQKVSENYWELAFIKDRNKLAQYYAAADLLIHPSLADTCPLTVFEALACATPVVAFKTEGISEMISHGKDGYLAGYKNIDDLIKGINYFYQNPEKCEMAGQRGREKVAKHYTLDMMVEKYSRLYEQVLHDQHEGINH